MPLALTTMGLLAPFLASPGKDDVRQGSSQRPAHRNHWSRCHLSSSDHLAVQYARVSSNIAAAVLCGAVGGIIIGLVTEYYTGGKPVRDIAKSGETGVATVMISGLSVGLKSVAIPMLTLAAIIFVSYEFAGLLGVGLAAVGMLGTVGITMAIDAYGPVADNAGGIAEMSAMGPETRKITDGLDAVGNTTAAIGKGFAIGAAGLAALALITAFIRKPHIVKLRLQGRSCASHLLCWPLHRWRCPLP